MSKKKTIAVAIVLALILLIGGMLAYFTDTDVAVNKFSLGDEIDIEITEGDGWAKDETTTEDLTDWTNENAQGIHPGTNVLKSPSVHNKSTTTPAYVFAEVIIPCYTNDQSQLTPVYTHTPNTGWTLINTPTPDSQTNTIKYVYAYGTSSAMTSLAASATTTTAVFSSVTLDANLTAAQATALNGNDDITVNAYGIQTDGLGTPAPAPATIFTYLPQI